MVRWQTFVDGIDGEGAWARLPAAAKQQLRDNIFTLLGQVGEKRASPYCKTEAQSITTPTLLIGGGDTKGALSVIWRVLAEHIPAPRPRSSQARATGCSNRRRRNFATSCWSFLAA